MVTRNFEHTGIIFLDIECAFAIPEFVDGEEIVTKTTGHLYISQQFICFCSDPDQSYHQIVIPTKSLRAVDEVKEEVDDQTEIAGFIMDIKGGNSKVMAFYTPIN
jgi:hypothetical protein